MTTVETTISTPVTVLPVSFPTIMDAPEFPSLLRTYAEECLVPGSAPQRAIYEAMEKAGTMQCFAASVDIAEDVSDVSTAIHCPCLIGFASVLTTIMPHDGQRLATIESIFVDPDFRWTGAGNSLLLAAEQHAAAVGCLALVYTVRVDSALETVLSRRAGCQRTHSVFTRWLNKGGGQE